MPTPQEPTPGEPTPGLRTPQFDHPGNQTPGGARPNTPSATGVAIDATGTTTLGSVDFDRDTTLVVTVTPTAADFNFQATVGGQDLFDAAQSPSAAAEEDFTPAPQRAVLTGREAANVVFEVTSPSGTTNATADVSVDVVSDDMT